MYQRQLKRRQLLQNAVGVGGGLAGILLTHTPPSYAAKRTLTVLSLHHYIEESDDLLRQMAREFEQTHNCRVRIDFIPHKEAFLQIPKEHRERRGHDIVFLLYSMPHLYREELETLDYMEALGHRLDGWHDLAREIGQVQGRWVAMPWYCVFQVMTYREDLYQQLGFSIPRTWEGWKRTGHQIKVESGHHAGITLNEVGDGTLTLYALLWAYGASTADADGRVTINSAETRRAMDYVKDLYELCMREEAFSWDASGNNEAFLRGGYSWVHNATSIYAVAKQKAPDLFGRINHTLAPSGPGGQHGTVVPLSFAVWRFAQEKELGKAFLAYIMDDPTRLETMFHLTSTYNTPLLNIASRFDWDRDPKTAMLRDFLKTAHLIGWPAPADDRAERVLQAYTVPKMFISYVTGRQSLESAVSWAEAELERTYRS